MVYRNVLIAVGVYALAGACLAQDLGTSITRTTKELRGREAEKRQAAGATILTPSPDSRPEAAPPAPPPIQTISVGVEVVDAESSRSTSIPFSYAYTTSSRMWNFRLESDYGRTTAGGTRLEGFGGVTALATRVLTQGKLQNDAAYQLLGTLGLGIPTRGDLGGSEYSQQARLIAVVGRKPWTGVLAGVLVHFNGTASHVADYARVIQGEVHYDLTPKDTLIGKLGRTHVRGVGGSNAVTLEYDRQLTANWGLEFSIARRFSGNTANSAQVTAVYGF